MRGGFETYLRLSLFVEPSLNSKVLFHVPEAINRSLLLVLNTRSRDVRIVSVVSRNLFGLERLQ